MQPIFGKPVTLQVPNEYRPILENIARENGIKYAQAVRALFLLGAEVYTDIHKGNSPGSPAGVLRLLAYCVEHGRPYEEKLLTTLL